MFKVLLICVILSLCAFYSIAQTVSSDSPVELMQRIGKSQPDTSRISLLVKLGSFYLLKPNSYTYDLDSAITVFNQAMQLSNHLHLIKWQNEILKLTGDCYLEGGDLQNGKTCFLRVIEYYQKIGDKKLEALAWYRFGECIGGSRDQESIQQKIYCNERSGALFKQTGNKLMEIQTVKELADVHMNAGKLDLAENELLKVLSMYKAINYKDLHFTYNLLSILNGIKGYQNKQLYYDLETIKSIELTGDMRSADSFYFQLAKTYSELGNHKKSLIFYHKALLYSKKQKNIDIYFSASFKIVEEMILNGEANKTLVFLNKVSKLKTESLWQKLMLNLAYGSSYSVLKRYDQAERCYSFVNNLSDSLYRIEKLPLLYRIRCINAVGNFYILSKQYRKAYICMNGIKAIPEGIASPLVMSQIELLRFKTDSAAGNYLAAIHHFEQHKQLQDSLFNTVKSKQIEELQIKYETDKKDKNILLLKKQAQLQENQVEKTRLARNVVIGGSIMLMLLLGVGYNRYRLKQRSNLQLQEKQKEITTKNIALERLLRDNEWLLREVHHRVKNNLQIVMSLLNSQSAYLQDEVALNAVLESQHRVQAMSLIHQKLYKTNNVSNIFMPDYIDDLVDYLKDSFKTGQKVYFETQIEPVNLDVLQAVPVGLILNEVITNAIKYAFPYGDNDRITIKLAKIDADKLILTITDNGRGLPPDFNMIQSASFGLTLVTGLAGELGGSLKIESINGTAISLLFKTEPIHQNI